MFASVLGMALSIEFGIARTYALGVGFYVLCALMIVLKPPGDPHGRVCRTPRCAVDPAGADSGRAAPSSETARARSPG